MKIQHLTGHNHVLTLVLELKNGNLVRASLDNSIKIWNMKTNKCVANLTGHSDEIIHLIELKNGNLLSASEDKTIKVWSAKLI